MNTAGELASGYWEKEGGIRGNGYHYTVIGLGASHGLYLDPVIGSCPGKPNPTLAA